MGGRAVGSGGGVLSLGIRGHEGRKAYRYI